MAEAVTLTLSAGITPTPGVIVHVYDNMMSLLVQALSNSAGEVLLLLPVGTAYVRMYKRGYKFDPFTIQVVINTASDYTVQGTILDDDADINPRICTVNGSLLDSKMDTNALMTLDFLPEFSAAVIDGCAVVPVRQFVKVFIDGLVHVKLLRNAIYNVIINGATNSPRRVMVPDLPVVNIGELLYPVVASVEFTPAITSPYLLDLDDTVEFATKVLTSGGIEIPGPAVNDIMWTTDSETVSIERTSTGIKLMGIRLGSAVINARRLDKTVVHIPDLPIVGVPFTIIVV